MSKNETDIVTGSVPVPDVQRVYLDREWSDYEYPDYMEKKYPAADEYVTWQLFGVQEELSQKILEQAINALLVHHDGLRSRMIKQDDRWLQYIVPPGEAVPLVWADLSSFEN